MDWMSLFFGVSRAVAETAGTTTTGTVDPTAEISPVASLISMLLPMVLIFVVFYFFLIRPQRKKDKQVKDMLNNLKVTDRARAGTARRRCRARNLKVTDRICTIGGIYGTITGIRDDTITLAVGKDNLQMVVARWAIRSVEEISIENDAEALN